MFRKLIVAASLCSVFATLQAQTPYTRASAAPSPLSVKPERVDRQDQTLATTCGETLAVKATCSISVTFKPEAAGSLTASVVVTDNANNVKGSIPMRPRKK
jgi:hypothetical protein